ncbi:MAG: hypothetical protein HDT22_01860 [Ruminococcus sp.]|nr:hypothetical protein [Ruminococcus sp.]
MQNFKKLIAGICSLAMLATGSMFQVSAFAKQEKEIILPDNFLYYKGDLNQDISVDIADIILMQKYLLGLQTISHEQFDISDMNYDNIVNIYDFVLLKRAVLNHNWEMVLDESSTIEPIPTEETTEPPTDFTESTDPNNPTEEPTESNKFITAPISEITASLPTQGNANLVIFYVDFPDCQYDYAPSEEELTEIAFGTENDSNANYPFESMTAFYKRSSKNAMKLTGKVFRYTTKENRSAYDADKAKLAKECYQAFDDVIDFSQFDGNGDSKIDATLFSVPTKAGDDDWWPCAGDSGIIDYMPDGMKIGHIITGNAQVESITDYKNFNSSYLHEMGHCMGLPDYYLYSSDDFEGFHGEEDTAGTELMDVDASTDFCCFSKLMLGWYKENQVSVYDKNKGGEQSFILNNAQIDNGNCLILPYGDVNYTGEYIILEYITPDKNNSSSVYSWITVGNGIRAYHVKADIHDNGWWTHFKYENGSEFTNNDDDGIRLIRLANDAEGGDVFKTGDVIDGKISGFHWYAPDETESIDTGYRVTIGECADGQYTITVTQN